MATVDRYGWVYEVLAGTWDDAPAEPTLLYAGANPTVGSLRRILAPDISVVPGSPKAYSFVRFRADWPVPYTRVLLRAEVPGVVAWEWEADFAGMAWAGAATTTATRFAVTFQGATYTTDGFPVTRNDPGSEPWRLVWFYGFEEAGADDYLAHALDQGGGVVLGTTILTLPGVTREDLSVGDYYLTVGIEIDVDHAAAPGTDYAGLPVAQMGAATFGVYAVEPTDLTVELCPDGGCGAGGTV